MNAFAKYIVGPIDRERYILASLAALGVESRYELKFPDHPLAVYVFGCVLMTVLSSARLVDLGASRWWAALVSSPLLFFAWSIRTHPSPTGLMAGAVLCAIPAALLPLLLMFVASAPRTEEAAQGKKPGLPGEGQPE